MDNALRSKLIRLELRLLQPEIRTSREELDQLIAEDVLEIGASGRCYDKEDILVQLNVSDETIWSAQDFSFRQLAPDIVLLVYKAKSQHDPAKSPLFSWRSSIWKFTADKWQLIFHQGTPCASFDGET